MIWFQYWRIFN